MQLQTILINNILLTSICVHVQTIPIFEKYYFTLTHLNNTNEFSLLTNPSLCITDNNCPQNSRCNENLCECNEGWLTLHNNNQCTYKQISKSSTFITSLFVGGIGTDWFILSRKNWLYILTGFLKFLVSIAGIIWIGIANVSKNERSKIPANCLGISLSLISVSWWVIDWIRILLNRFPDGNGGPLI
jgi:hypothetical protein